MANLTANEFMHKVENNAGFRAELGITSADISLDEFQAKAAAAGFNFTPEEIVAATQAQKVETLTDEDLDQVTGGMLVFRFKLVAVKTVSWSHD